jgi:hypothetical protein
MKNLISYSLLLFVFFGCNKNDNSIGDQAYLYGTITSENQLLITEAVARPIKKRSIFIASSPSDSVNFIYKVTTDSLGQYNFKGLNKGQGYLVFFRDTIRGNYYSVYQTLKPSENSQPLFAKIDTKELTGVKFKVTDSLGFPISDALIYLYRSRIVAEAKNIKGSIYQLKSDSNGEALQTGMNFGEWFIYANFKVDATNNLMALQNLVVNKNQITNSTIVIRK